MICERPPQQRCYLYHYFHTGLFLCRKPQVLSLKVFLAIPTTLTLSDCIAVPGSPSPFSSSSSSSHMDHNYYGTDETANFNATCRGCSQTITPERCRLSVSSLLDLVPAIILTTHWFGSSFYFGLLRLSATELIRHLLISINAASARHQYGCRV